MNLLFLLRNKLFISFFKVLFKRYCFIAFWIRSDLRFIFSNFYRFSSSFIYLLLGRLYGRCWSLFIQHSFLIILFRFVIWVILIFILETFFLYLLIINFVFNTGSFLLLVNFIFELRYELVIFSISLLFLIPYWSEV